MKVFTSAHFLRQISIQSLREFTEDHILGTELNIEWNQPAESLLKQLSHDIADLELSLAQGTLSPDTVKDREHNLHLWHDDLRRIHLMSNTQAIEEFRSSLTKDLTAIDAFRTRDVREQAMWVFIHRNELFRTTELHMAFLAKTNGKYWKKHRIQSGLDIPQDRDKLETFCAEVAKLYEKAGGGKSTHVEYSKHTADDSIQLTLYVEGPVTALTHFEDKHFSRLTTRIALESAVVYRPATGEIETVVKGGAKNHAAMLTLFGTHVVGMAIDPTAVEMARYNLDALRSGVLEPFDSWTSIGVTKVRLRRARFTPHKKTGISFQVEAPSEPDQTDAIGVARDHLKINQTFEAEYHINGATFLVYLLERDGKKPRHFSFDVYATGSSTIKNLTEKNQTTAEAVLKGLQIVDHIQANS
ncbi:hypothetical protein [Ferrovum sp.]|uniref:hypothetical protein n=1 Tax=Ferrovum sp. TaxID=2609467 RepID=UPI00261A7BC4|nr:hypothetical protein [Ferrovum sp.]